MFMQIKGTHTESEIGNLVEDNLIEEVRFGGSQAIHITLVCLSNVFSSIQLLQRIFYGNLGFT